MLDTIPCNTPVIYKIAKITTAEPTSSKSVNVPPEPRYFSANLMLPVTRWIFSRYFIISRPAVIPIMPIIMRFINTEGGFYVDFLL